MPNTLRRIDDYREGEIVLRRDEQGDTFLCVVRPGEGVMGAPCARFVGPAGALARPAHTRLFALLRRPFKKTLAPNPTMHDLRLGWYAVRFFRRPWTWRPTLTTRTVAMAATWGRWGVQVMRTDRHPRVREAMAEPTKYRVRVTGEADGHAYKASASFAAPPTPRDIEALRTLCEVAAAAARAGLLDATVNQPPTTDA